MQVYENFPLIGHNTFGLAARAERFVSVRSADELREAARLPLPKRLIGGGSNVLMTSELLEGLTIHVSIKGVEILGAAPHGGVLVRAMAGTVWHDLVQWTLSKGLSGLENLSLIPGTVGASPIQNIGAYGVELCDVFQELEALHLESGQTRRFTAEECAFGYRDSVFKRELKGQYAILAVTLRLRTEPALRLDYGDIRQMLAEMGVTNPGPRDVGEAVCRIRRAKLPDPAQLGNAGSFFKNPVVPQALFEACRAAHPEIPGYPGPNGVKVPAGWLIERSGWKGRRIGPTGCHDKQALVLVNHGGATGRDVAALSDQIRRDVLERFGIALETEVNFW